MSAKMPSPKPTGRVFSLREQIIAVITSLLVSSLAPAALAEENTSTSEPANKSAPSAASTSDSDVSKTFNEVETLVKEFYPKAKIVRTENNLHFEYKARGLTGTQSGLKELSPDSGGIAGDVVVKPGRYAGHERNPSETNLILHMVYFTAPYSEPADRHFFTRLSYPPDASIEFLSRFKTMIDEQKKGAQEIAVKVAPPAPAVSESKTSSTSGDLASTPQAKPSTEPKVSFGSRKLSKYSYPEGRFKILLPGNPNCRYGNVLGMRSVDYNYPESQGAYLVSYLIAPGVIDESKVSVLLDAVCTSLTKSTRSAELRRNAITLQGFQGRQLELVPKEGKEILQRFRLYVVRRFVYIIGVAGNKPWVDSPAAAEYLNSLEVVPELTAAEQHAASVRAFERKQEDSRKTFDERFAKSRLDSQEAASRARKDFERSQADFKYRRY
jgi:hypothetical protein